MSIIGGLTALFIILSIVAYVITQFALGFFTGTTIIINIIILILCFGIFFGEAKGLFGKNKKSNKLTTIEDNEKKINKFDPNHFTSKDQLWARLTAGLCCIVLLVVSFLFYKYLYNGTKTEGATLVTVTVVSVEDETTTTKEYDIDGNETDKIEEKCKVTFRYELDGETHDIIAYFKSRTISDKSLNVYVKDGEFVSTQLELITCKIAIIYLIVLAAITLFTVFFWYNYLYNIISTVFSAAFSYVFILIQTSFTQIFYISFGSLLLLLGEIGIVCLIYTCYCGIQRYKNNKISITDSYSTWLSKQNNQDKK